MEKQTIYLGCECGAQLIVDNQHLFFVYAKNALFDDVAFYAEDAAMDSIEKALKKVHTFKGTLAQFRSWIKFIVTNTCRDYGKKKRPFLTADGSMCPNFFEEEEIPYSELRGVSKKRLKMAVRNLKPKFRDVIILTYFYKMSGREIAFQTGMNENSVPQTRKRALSALKEELNCSFL